MQSRVGAVVGAFALLAGGCFSTAEQPAARATRAPAMTAASAIASAAPPPAPATPPERAPPAGSIAIEPPPGVDFSVPALPNEPEFAPLEDKWWQKPAACPKGAKLVKEPNPSPDHLPAIDHFLRCKLGKQYVGPQVLIYKKTGARFEESQVRDGRHYGLFRSWSSDGTLLCEEHRDRSGPIGPQKNYWAKGALAYEGAYVGGARHGLWIEGTNWGGGGLISRGYYVHGVKEGRFVGEFHGVTIVSVGYSKGKLHGDARLWRSDGEPMAIGSFADGDGAWTGYRRGGAQATTLRCAAGKGSVTGDLDPVIPDPGAPLRERMSRPSENIDPACAAESVVSLWLNQALAPEPR